MVLQQVGEWTDAELPRLNRAILGGEIPPGRLAEQCTEVLFPLLPQPDRVPAEQAKRLAVRLGFVGASLGRHYQEWTPDGKRTPERAYDGLTIGDLPFRQYFGVIAERTGTGHCGRDTYASLVRWNVGTLKVLRGTETMAVLPGVFDDGKVRSYTGTPGEERFFLLVKKGEAIELAINDVLDPLTRPEENLLGADALDRVRLATELLGALRELFRDFAVLPPERSMPTDQFLDVFRQFAVHWTPDDIPPSGALDPEALKRDFLLGINLDGYEANVRRLFPALLTTEREAIEPMMAEPTLPERMLAGLGRSAASLRAAERGDLVRLVGEHPGLADWYMILAAHARAAGAHLMLSKKFLFKPQQRRDAAGLGDRPLVSNRAGTTGMNETFLERITRARQDHPLAPLRTVVTRETAENTTNAGVPSPISVSRVG
ncbi:hypothetical protein [Actinoplanes sp. NPDC051411]|uniref:hypothetical protein n=1 Tax=Actinoplanes sp. NPDC051411 TaxID=3155522 RepID=UPI0034348320